MKNQTQQTGQTIPIYEAKNIGQKYGYTQVIVVAFDDKTGTTSVVTWGKDPKQSEQAASGGNAVKKSFKWPEELCQAKSNRPSLQIESDFLNTLNFERNPYTGTYFCFFKHGEYDSVMVRKLEDGDHEYQILIGGKRHSITQHYSEFCQAIDALNAMSYEEYSSLYLSNKADESN